MCHSIDALLSRESPKQFVSSASFIPVPLIPRTPHLFIRVLAGYLPLWFPPFRGSCATKMERQGMITNDPSVEQAHASIPQLGSALATPRLEPLVIVSG